MPRGLTITWFPLASAKVPPSSTYGDPKERVPVNGAPLLQAAVTVAALVPAGEFDGMDGDAGVTVRVNLGGGAPSGAEHDAVLPPLIPLQVQVHPDPVSVTAEAVPALHNPLVGALFVATPFAEPHAPSIFCCAAAAVVMPISATSKAAAEKFKLTPIR
jgi:hypothetical protein